MPIIKNTVRLRSEKSRTENHLSLALQDRLYQRWVLRRIVFEICVLNDQNGRHGLCEPCTKRRALAAILGVTYCLYTRILSEYWLKRLPSRVFRAVVHHND